MARKTIDDVAALAGVSIKTVSRVLNDEPSVRPDTRGRVEDAMAALNYQPSLPARSLAGRRSNLIGLVYENPSANYVFDVQSGAMARCREGKLRLFIQSCNGLGDQLLGEVLAMIEQTHVDGLVVTPPLSANRALIALLERQGLPFVRIGPDEEDFDSPAVVIDDEAAAAAMTDYLLDLGHERIGFITGHPEHCASHLRKLGYRQAFRKRGRKAPEDLTEQGYNTAASGREAALLLLRRADRPTAIFASNDDMAAGVVLAAHELGLEVPRDLSVAGYDDTQLARIVWPTLTTIHQPTYNMSHCATGLLIDLIRGNDVPRVTRLDFTMQKRGSTAPPL
ncbi:MAG: LacI family DNA-binding transcriptional regulator [Sphingomonadaceae bacterium]|nr:LacI family DNA-binding transcriptional regulator [Sphingomonadaceae bacterium]